MTCLTRLTVLTGFGTAALAAAVPALPVKSPGPCRPSIESFFGAERMAALRATFRAKDDLIVNTMNETELLDDNDHFRVSPEFRENWVEFLLHGTPFDQLVDFSQIVAASDGQRYLQAKAEEDLVRVFRQFDLIGNEHHVGVPRPSPWRVRWWRGDGWKLAGWPDPSDSRYWLRSPKLYRSRLALWDQILNP
jgi:hypothetical protein